MKTGSRLLEMDVYERPKGGEVKEPLGFGGHQVNAPMTHGYAKIIMPVCPMERIPTVIIHRIRDPGEIIARTCHGSRG